jgi:hypothetical protein
MSLSHLVKELEQVADLFSNRTTLAPEQVKEKIDWILRTTSQGESYDNASVYLGLLSVLCVNFIKSVQSSDPRHLTTVVLCMCHFMRAIFALENNKNPNGTEGYQGKNFRFTCQFKSLKTTKSGSIDTQKKV